ncbi:MAG: hypothetical protein IJD38_05740 [Clostridia bacterium]|nr:hypothetical protein [Clostridia bacterium]
MKQYLILFIALILCLAVFVACDEIPATDTTAGEEGTTAEPSTRTPTEAPTEQLTEAPTEAPTEPEPALTELVIDAENSGRILVAYYNRGEGPASDSVFKSAEGFRDRIKSKTDLMVRITRVRETSDSNAVSFLIGETPYEETAAVKASLPANSYAVQVVGRKIVIIGSDDVLTVKALKDFCDRVLDNPERTMAGKLIILPEDSFTVTLDKPYTVGDMVADGLTPTADYTEILHTPKQGQYSISQGAASDGTFVYIALRNSDDSGAVIAKHRLDDGSFVAVSEPMNLGHANDMTFNTEKNLLVVAHGQKQGKIITLVNPDTLEFIEDVNIEKGAGAISYNPATNAYAISQGGKSLHMLDKDLGYVTSHERTKLEGYTAQGMGSDENYIYFPMSGAGQNILDTFDWEGNRVCQVILPTPHESESLFYVNGRHFVSFNYDGGTVYEIFFRCYMTAE